MLIFGEKIWLMADNNKGEVIIYQSEDGNVKLDVHLENETVWLTQQQMAYLFGKSISTINEHIKDVFESKELLPAESMKKFGISEFQQKAPFYYNLDVIISVGYRVHSVAGTRFRQWATKRLHEYIVKGWTMDVERLKGNGGGQYWYDLLNTIKDIRSSEKVLYRQVLDLFATSIDYDASNEETRLFFKIVQNKLHFATHGQTAAELIFSRADADKEFMGLTSFRGTHPTVADISIAKNYLNETELRYLNNLVSGYFDFAENQALMRKPMTMHDYRVLLDNLLSANGSKILEGPGGISSQQAHEKALAEYRKYQVRELTPVERAYLASLQETAREIKEG